MDSYVKWYFIGISVMLAMVFGGLATQQWRQMDCKISLSQAGRSAAEINEICR
jgi:protein-S-isoprenylcysteine O-methyltransferase Ste14